MMTPAERTHILSLLDSERQTVVYPGVLRFTEGALVRDVSLDGKICEVIYARATEEDVDRMVKREVRAARRAPYELEWKLYGHDQPHCLAERLVAAGFEAGDREAFMVLRVSNQAGNVESAGMRSSPAGALRMAENARDLEDARLIMEEVQERSCEDRIAHYREMLEKHPSNMSLYIASIRGQPASCGRVYFHGQSRFAALYGGQTRPGFRHRGLFSQIVRARVGEAWSRGVDYVCVDALPTSEPILRKLGFEAITWTQPFKLKASRPQLTA